MATKALSREDKFNFIASHNSDTPEPLDLVTPTPHVPRYYQINCVRNAASYLEVGFMRLLFVSPTGSGKTMLARMTATSNEVREAMGINDKIRKNPDYKVRVLMLAHENQLLVQARNTFAGCDDIELITHSSFANISDELLEKGWDMTFIDEGHHEAMFSVQKLLGRLSLKPIIGLTATPDRGDGLMLKYERFIYAITKPEAIKRKFISRPDINSILDGGGSSKIELAKEVFEECGDEMGQTIVYFKTKKECREFTYHLVEKGYKARFLDDNKTMAEILKEFESKEIQFIVNCQKLGEGTDIKGCTDVFLCRQFNSKGEKEQYIGRCIRIDSKAVVWEFVNPFKNNILATDLFPVYGFHRFIYKQKDENGNRVWFQNYLEINDDSIYDHEYLNRDMDSEDDAVMDDYDLELENAS